MIVKEKISPEPSDPLGKAGYLAEKQMAFYLRRAFADAPDILVFNDLRLERQGEFAQIDHLVVHRFGFAIVESKSVTGELVVNAQGEFARLTGRSRRGMQSPIQQAQLQADMLGKLLNDNKEVLRRKMLFGTHQGQFSKDRFRVFVAISDQGIIRREGRDHEELCKADSITDKINASIAAYAQATGFSGFVKFMISTGEDARRLERNAVSPFTDEELDGLQSFLLQQHVPLRLEASSPKTSAAVKPEPTARDVAEGCSDHHIVPATEPAAIAIGQCRHCSSNNMVMLHGRYGYYYKCMDCQGNTPADPKCTSCGAKARIRKSGREFFRSCEKCRTEVGFHENPERGTS